MSEEQQPVQTQVTLSEEHRSLIITVTREARGPQETVEDLTRAQAAALNLCLEVLGITNQDIDNYQVEEGGA